VSDGVLEALYGLEAPDGPVRRLLDHRGVLQLVLGAGIVAAAVRPRWLLPVTVGVAVAKGSFLALVLTDEVTRRQFGPTSVVVDLVSIAVLVAACVVQRRLDTSGRVRA